MRKILFIALALFVALSGLAIAQGFLPVGAFDNSDADIALPSKSGYRVCVAGWKFDATNATDDINVYSRTGDETYITADVAAAGTEITLAASTGIATNAVVIIERSDGTYADIKSLSAIGTDLVATIGALDKAFKKGDRVFEVGILWEYADVGTDAAEFTSGGSGLFCGPVGSPLGAIIDANLMIYMSGFYGR